MEMEERALLQYFSTQWTTKVGSYGSLLEPDEFERAKQLQTMDDVQKLVFGSDEEPLMELAPLRRTFLHFQTFTAIFQKRLGTSLDCSLTWALLGLNLKLCQQHQQSLKIVPRFIRTLGWKLELFESYCPEAVELESRVREACFDIQISISNSLSNHLALMHRIISSEEIGSSGVGNTWASLISLHATAATEIDETLINLENWMKRSRSLNEPMTLLSIAPLNQRPSRIVVLPPAHPCRFFNRDDFDARIDGEFENIAEDDKIRSVALHGLGGVGKSTTALRYVEHKLSEGSINAVFWIHGEKDMAMKQSFTDIALRLKLSAAKPQAHDENFLLVQDWLRETDNRWLVVFDNVESAALVRKYWPTAVPHGKAIITTRDRSLAFDCAATSLEVFSWDAETGSKFLMFLLARSVVADIAAETTSALQLCRKLDGHALTVSHMAGLIQQRSWTIRQFFEAYQQNPRRLHTSASDAIWQLSFESLSRNSATLLGILSFLMPDSIYEEAFREGPVDDLPPELNFCTDDFSFSDATENLLTSALLQRDPGARVLSVHRMVQTQFKFFLKLPERQAAFWRATTLIWRIFPRESGTKLQLYNEWKLCEKYVQHVLHLKDSFKTELEKDKTFRGSLHFCKLLMACSRYMVETHNYNELGGLCEVAGLAISTLDPAERSTDLVCSRLSYIAIMQEGTGEPLKALVTATKGYNLRLDEQPVNHLLLCSSENNIGYIYNTANNHAESKRFFERTRQRWAASVRTEDGEPIPWSTVTKKNFGRCLIYLDEHDEAEKLLSESIKEFKSSPPVNWAMLAYALFALGTLETRRKQYEKAEGLFAEAHNVWLSGDLTRTHPFNGGCLYRLGWCALRTGRLEIAAKYFNDSMVVTQLHVGSMATEHARNLFALSELLEEDLPAGSPLGRAEELRKEAERLLRQRHPETSSANREDDYHQFIPIFWR